jgi:hypothetical protein
MIDAHTYACMRTHILTCRPHLSLNRMHAHAYSYCPHFSLNQSQSDAHLRAFQDDFLRGCMHTYSHIPSSSLAQSHACTHMLTYRPHFSLNQSQSDAHLRASKTIFSVTFYLISACDMFTHIHIPSSSHFSVRHVHTYSHTVLIFHSILQSDAHL